MRNSKQAIFVVMMLLVVAFLPIVRTQAQTDPLEVIDVQDEGLDDDQVDPLFEFLSLKFNVMVTEAGKYTFTAQLIFNNITHLMNANNMADLDVGQQLVILKFNSTPIYKNGRDGYFVVNYFIKKDSFLLEGSYTTQQYGYMQFDDPSYILPTPERFHPQIFKEPEQERIVLKNDILTARFYYKVPLVEWFYTKDNKSMAKFYCLYKGLHGYFDDGSYRFNLGRSIYEGSFEDSPRIEESKLFSGDSKIYGKYVSFTVTFHDIPIIKRDSGKTERLANVTITLLLASGDMDIGNDQNEFVVRAGTELKIDIGIDLVTPLQINGLALEQEIWSESKKGYYHDFELMDTHNREILRGSTDDDEQYFNYRLQEPQMIYFQSKYTKPRSKEGYYFWTANANIDRAANSAARMTYSFNPDNKHLRLYLAFITLGNSITTIESDPGIGIVEESNPSKKNFIPPEPPEPPNILVTIAGWLSAVCLVILPLWIDFRRAKRKLRELEEEYGDIGEGP